MKPENAGVEVISKVINGDRFNTVGCIGSSEIEIRAEGNTLLVVDNNESSNPVEFIVTLEYALPAVEELVSSTDNSAGFRNDDCIVP